jgi:methionyl-tRNA synthetase
MSSSEYLNYESGKFSKSKGIGVFGSDAKETGIPADVWRFYLFYNRPEKSDAVFTWKDFQEKVNSELIGNLGNLVNRTLSFVHRFYDGKIPEGGSDPEFWEKVKEMEGEITKHLDRAELRDAFRKIFALADMGNKFFQAGEPWKTRTSEPEAAARLLRDLTYLVRDLGILLSPFIPAAEVIGKWLRTGKLSWKDLGSLTGIAHIEKPEILFKRLEDKEIKTFKERFAGSQKERKEKEQVIKEEVPLEQLFSEKIDLRAAKITAIERHPEADKLYIETVNLGGEERQIVSGLVPYYKEDELIDRTIILVRNLKSAKLRGIKSEGMLLAVEGNDSLEVLFVDNAEPGTPLLIKEAEPVEPRERKRITIDKFFEIPLRVEDHILKVGDTEIHVSGKPVRTNKVRNGEVG